MPLSKRWSSYTKDRVGQESNNYGVYEIGNSEEILYIGEGHVKARLLSHFPNRSEPVVGASYYRCDYTGGKKRAVQRQNAGLAAFQRKHGRLPKFNQRRRN